MWLFFKAIILGVVEGVTEFLPISSTGHLILMNQWISFDPAFTKLFDVVIQLGAVLAVLVSFRGVLCPCTSPKETRPQIFALWKKLLVAVVPALILGALFGDFVDEHLFRPMVVAITLALGGVALIVLEKRSHAERVHSIADISFQSALLIGVFQCLAMVPGTSRSAATIIGALLLGVSRTAAVEFSFFLAVPTIAAASAYGLLKQGHMVSAQEYALLATGFLTAFFVAWVVITQFLRFVRKHSLTQFGYYRVALGLLILFFLR